MKKNDVWVGIGINFTQEDSGYNELVALNGLLVRKHGSKHVFRPVKNLPHINLYDINVPKDNLSLIASTLISISERNKGFSVFSNKIGYFDHGSVFLEIDANNQLQNLENDVVNSLVVFKEGCKTEEYWQPWRKYDDKQIYNRQKYGNPHVLDTFVPHITIGFVRADRERLEKIVNNLNDNFYGMNIQCGHIDLVVHDENGNHLSSKRFVLMG